MVCGVWVFSCVEFCFESFMFCWISCFAEFLDFIDLLSFAELLVCKIAEVWFLIWGVVVFIICGILNDVVCRVVSFIDLQNFQVCHKAATCLIS